MKPWLKGLVLIAVSASVTAAFASDKSPKPFPDFKSKTVKPPKAGQKKLITIQIEETTAVESAEAESAKDQDASDVATSNVAGWFWDKVSPDLDNAGPDRLEPALNALMAAPEGTNYSPRLVSLAEIVAQRGVQMMLGTVDTQVSPALALAVISVESGGKADAVSKAGAEGLMQLMPATAEHFGVTDSFDAGQNIKGGVAFLDYLMSEFDRDPVLVLAAYNAGPNAVRQHGGVPPFDETRAYVPKVLAAFQVARGLCLTPPTLITDGCVFVRLGN